MERFCRQCGSPVAEGARFCRMCGATTGMLQAPAPEGQGEPGPNEAPPPVTPLSPTERMTDKLADPSGPLQTGPPTAPVASRQRQPVMIVLALVVLGLCAAAWFAYRLIRPATEQSAVGQPASPPIQASQPPEPPQTAGGETVSTPPPADPAGQAATPGRTEIPKEPKPSEVAAKRNSRASSVPPPPRRSTPEPVGRGSPAVTAEQHLIQGRDHLNAGRYSEALIEFQRVRRLDPANQDVFYLMGVSYDKLGQLEDALGAFRNCTSGPYAGVSSNHVKRLAKKLRK